MHEYGKARRRFAPITREYADAREESIKQNDNRKYINSCGRSMDPRKCKRQVFVANKRGGT